MQTRTYGVLALAACALVGCKPDAPAAQASDAATDAAAPAAPQQVVIRTRDYQFAEAPDTIESGVTTFRLQNEGPDAHHVFLVRLDDGHTIDELTGLMASAGPWPSWAVDAGGPNTAGGSGTESSATVDLQPGSYAMICVIPAADGQPHIMKGMLRTLTVVPSSGPAVAMPAADVDMILSDYAFDLKAHGTAAPATLKAGRNVINVTNAAAQSHEVLIVKIEPGKTVMEVLAFLEKPAGPPPGMPIGGTSPLARGQTNQIAVDLAPGEYGFICFVPDAKDGRPHFLHGMTKQFTVM